MFQISSPLRGRKLNCVTAIILSSDEFQISSPLRGRKLHHHYFQSSPHLKQVSNLFPFTGTETHHGNQFEDQMINSRVSNLFPFTGTETFSSNRCNRTLKSGFKSLPLYGDGNF